MPKFRIDILTSIDHWVIEAKSEEAALNLAWENPDVQTLSKFDEPFRIVAEKVED